MACNKIRPEDFPQQGTVGLFIHGPIRPVVGVQEEMPISLVVANTGPDEIKVIPGNGPWASNAIRCEGFWTAKHEPVTEAVIAFEGTQQHLLVVAE